MGCDVMIIGLMSLPNSFVYMSFHPVAYLIKLQIEMALGDLIVTISTAKPARSAFDSDFGGLKIAVSTHTTTTAVRFDDADPDNEKDAMRKTRTPARPDLSIRLEKMRSDRKARKAAEADGGQRRQGAEQDSDDEDVKIDMEASARSWNESIHQLPAHGTYTPSPTSASIVDEKL
ncbi:hypothetical protein JCM11491_001853 [Sporobolomyces phaffii]